MGQAVARLVLQKPGLKLVGVSDLAALHAGKDAGTVLGFARKLGVKIDADPERFGRKVAADVAFVCTSSLLKDVKPLVAALVSRRIHVLTTCEELAYPVPARAAAFREIDRLASARKVSVLATGVNPGFAMDTLALALTAPCAAVRRVSVTRVVDAGARRLPLQRRVGAGLNLGQFRRAVTEGTVRHVGLVEPAPHDRRRPRGGSSTASTRRSSPRSHRVTSTPTTCASRPARPPASASRCARTAAATSS